MPKNRFILTRLYACLLYAFLYSAQLYAGDIDIYPFKISREVIDFGKVETGDFAIQEITFTNNQDETVSLNSLRIEQVVPPAFELTEPPQFPIKFNPKNSGNTKSYTFRCKFTPKKNESLQAEIIFRYSTKNEQNVQADKGIPLRGTGEGPVLRVEPIEFIPTIVDDTTNDFIVIRNEGNKEAEFRFSEIKFEPDTSPFAIKTSFLNEFKNKVISIQPQNSFRIPIQFSPIARIHYASKCIVRLVGNIKPGYDALKEIVIRGLGVRPPEIETMLLQEQLTVNIGDTTAIKVHVKLKDVPQGVTQLILKTQLAFRDGALALAYNKDVEQKDYGTVANGRRIVDVVTPLLRKNSEPEFESELPVKIVGVFSDNDTTELSLNNPEVLLRRFMLGNQFEKVRTNVYINGFWEDGDEKRVLLLKGKGNVGIVMENPVKDKDLSIKFNGLTRSAILRIYNNNGSLAIEREVNSPSLTLPKGLLDFGTYTAILLYGYEYSTNKFVVEP